MADRVFGQPDFVSSVQNNGGVSASSLGLPAGVAVDGSGRLWIADWTNNRVLEFDDPLTDAVADRVFGQPDFTSNAANNGGVSASSLNAPARIAIDSDGRLWVTDRMNHRVLVYDDPLTNAVADHVLGQPDFVSNAETIPPTAQTFRYPFGLAIDSSGRLWVADSSNNRVLEFDDPLTDSVGDRVFGQPDFASSAAGVSATSLAAPIGLAVDGGGSLWVADQANARVLRYDSPLSNATADRVFGQPDFDQNVDNNGGVSASSMYRPADIVISSGNQLWVPDWQNHRVLEFDDADQANLNATFSVDVDPSAMGVQTSRTVVEGQQFSIAVRLSTESPDWGTYQVTVDFDDVSLTGCSSVSACPVDWADAAVTGTSGGNVVVFTTLPPLCTPPGTDALLGEDNVGIATYTVTCSEDQPAATTGHVGSLIEFVFRCDEAGTTSITPRGIADTFILDSNLQPYNAFVDSGSIECVSDADGDGMPDDYENARPCLNASVADGSADPDGDTLANSTEYGLGTQPCVADSDGDTMGDGYEVAQACLDPTVSDGGSDGDSDGLTNVTETGIGTEPCVNDTDGDRCADGEEMGGSILQGGQRDPLNPWDFYDVNASKKVDAIDIALVRSKFTQNFPPYDRSPGAHTWAPGPPDGVVNSIDIGLVRASYFHSCQAPP